MDTMSGGAARLLYLSRHAEPDQHGTGLSPAGSQQAQHLGRRLAPLAVDRITHGPLPRAAETAGIVAQQFERRPALSSHEAAGDYVPSLPRPDEVPDAWADSVTSFLQDVSDAEASRGATRAAEAVDLLAGTTGDGRSPVDVVVTHAFTIGWLVAHALGAPPWRWFPPTACHAALTVIRYASDAPPTVVVANDMAHLSPALRWTGFPEHLRP